MGKRAKPSPFAPLERDVEPPLRKLSFVRARYASASARVSRSSLDVPASEKRRRHSRCRVSLRRRRRRRADTSRIAIANDARADLGRPASLPSTSRLPAAATAGARTRPWFPRRRRGA